MLQTPVKNGCHFAKGSFIYNTVVEYDLLDNVLQSLKKLKSLFQILKDLKEWMKVMKSSMVVLDFQKVGLKKQKIDIF